MNFVFDNANQNDIDELIRLRLAFITEDAGSLSSLQEQCIEEQLRDFFNRKLGKELSVVEPSSQGNDACGEESEPLISGW